MTQPRDQPGPLAILRTWGEMIKFSHSVFALPFALVAVFLAARHRSETFLPPLRRGGWGGFDRTTVWLLLLIVICMVGARSFAMTFNRIADAAIDARNPRTSGRPIPAGRITLRQAWAFAAAAAAVFVAACGGFWRLDNNPWPSALSIPVLGYLAAYSFAKRFTSLAHFVLGAAIASAPVAAWIAVHPASVGWPALCLFIAAATWLAGFDIIYSCQDVDVDRRESLHSLPARLGIGPALWISRGCHVVTVLMLGVLPLCEPLGRIYLAGVAGVAILLAAEQSVVRAGDLSRVNLAFFTLNGFVSLLFATTTITDVMLRGGK